MGKWCRNGGVWWTSFCRVHYLEGAANLRLTDLHLYFTSALPQSCITPSFRKSMPAFHKRATGPILFQASWIEPALDLCSTSSLHLLPSANCMAPAKCAARMLLASSLSQEKSSPTPSPQTLKFSKTDSPLEIPYEEGLDQAVEIANTESSNPNLEGVTPMDDTSGVKEDEDDDNDDVPLNAKL
ncbi:hypothetical protein HAX54_044430 [Datura stramonium]|uniref:Uncharacterized protein n=1 Tax=Datura stramonium TaxID=4076 RepID=A0ABS8SQM1_DATST|nr:hypothetical protein [Datura stramonium]